MARIVSQSDPGIIEYVGDGAYVYVYLCAGACGCEKICQEPLGGIWWCANESCDHCGIIISAGHDEHPLNGTDDMLENYA